MEHKAIFKILSFAGMAVGFVGTLLTGWADGKEQEKLIEEKVNEALTNRNNEENEEEEES